MKKITKSLVLTATGAIILILRLLGISVDAPYVNQIAEAVCALLIVLGIITAPKDGGDSPENGDDTPSDSD